MRQLATPAATQNGVRDAVRHVSVASAATRGRLLPPASLPVAAWDPNTSNTQAVQGFVRLDGQPVAGAVVSIGGWVDPTPTDATGAFDYPVDVTTPDRHVASVVGVERRHRRRQASERRAAAGAARRQRRHQRRLPGERAVRPPRRSAVTSS